MYRARRLAQVLRAAHKPAGSVGGPRPLANVTLSATGNPMRTRVGASAAEVAAKLPGAHVDPAAASTAAAAAVGATPTAGASGSAAAASSVVPGSGLRGPRGAGGTPTGARGHLTTRVYAAYIGLSLVSLIAGGAAMHALFKTDMRIPDMDEPVKKKRAADKEKQKKSAERVKAYVKPAADTNADT